MAEQVEIKAKVVQTEVKALVLRHKKALEERECELLWKVSGHIFGEGGGASGGTATHEITNNSRLCGKSIIKRPQKGNDAMWTVNNNTCSTLLTYGAVRNGVKGK